MFGFLTKKSQKEEIWGGEHNLFNLLKYEPMGFTQLDIKTKNGAWISINLKNNPSYGRHCERNEKTAVIEKSDIRIEDTKMDANKVSKILDTELKLRDGEANAFYAEDVAMYKVFNLITALGNAVDHQFSNPDRMAAATPDPETADVFKKFCNNANYIYNRMQDPNDVCSKAELEAEFTAFCKRFVNDDSVNMPVFNQLYLTYCKENREAAPWIQTINQNKYLVENLFSAVSPEMCSPNIVY